MHTADVKTFTVSEITRLIRTVLEREIGALWISGEISNLRMPASGHCYFTLKDAEAQIGAVIWRSDLRRLAFAPRDGMQVRIQGQLSVYERGGIYQVVVRTMEASGAGALYAAFLKLKAKLEAEGLFDPARKRALPRLPRHVGLVTSPTGAAIRDILTVITRRFPNLHVVIAPVRVQGPGAAEDIVAAIELLNRRGGLDVLIVGRGGGSLEDLWCFNEEIVARAIGRSAIPVISAVGHEIDFTISDFVADLRAPTPSGAAELVVGCKEEFESRLDACRRRLCQALQASVAEARYRLDRARASHVFREPSHLVQLACQRLQEQRQRMCRSLLGRLREWQQHNDELRSRLTREIRTWHDRRVQDVSGCASQLRALSPLAVLARGFSLTRDAHGAILRSAAQVRPGSQITTHLARGVFDSEVRRVHEQKEE